jgi:hypothetical protein
LQNSVTLRGKISVKQFAWEAGSLAVDGDVKVSGALFETTLVEAKEVRMFLGDDCPPRWEEVQGSAGYMLVSRPPGGASGARRNAPFADGEDTRVLQHAHNVTVDDPGTKPSRVTPRLTQYCTLPTTDIQLGQSKITDGVSTYSLTTL